jgi:hypothetical protein
VRAARRSLMWSRGQWWSARACPTSRTVLGPPTIPDAVGGALNLFGSPPPCPCDCRPLGTFVDILTRIRDLTPRGDTVTVITGTSRRSRGDPAGWAPGADPCSAPSCRRPSAKLLRAGARQAPAALRAGWIGPTAFTIRAGRTPAGEPSALAAGGQWPAGSSPGRWARAGSPTVRIVVLEVGVVERHDAAP